MSLLTFHSANLKNQLPSLDAAWESTRHGLCPRPTASRADTARGARGPVVKPQPSAVWFLSSQTVGLTLDPGLGHGDWTRWHSHAHHTGSQVLRECARPTTARAHCAVKRSASYYLQVTCARSAGACHALVLAVNRLDGPQGPSL